MEQGFSTRQARIGEYKLYCSWKGCTPTYVCWRRAEEFFCYRPERSKRLPQTFITSQIRIPTRVAQPQPQRSCHANPLYKFPHCRLTSSTGTYTFTRTNPNICSTRLLVQSPDTRILILCPFPSWSNRRLFPTSSYPKEEASSTSPKTNRFSELRYLRRCAICF